MPKYHVHKSVVIDKPVGEVFEFMKDFQHSKSWDPWMVCDPEAEQEYSEKYSKWNGEYVGEGEMRLVDETKDKYLEYALEFKAPYKSKAKVWYDFEEKDGGTEVNWHMDGSLPWFMFWMKNTMKGMIGMDFKRGLMMLKDVIENGEIGANSSYEGIVDLEVPYLVGYKAESSIDDIASSMGPLMEKLMKRANELGWKMAGAPLALYTKWDPAKGRCEYYVCLQLNDVKGVDDQEFEIIDFEAGKAMKGLHTGAYKHLGNVWSMLMMRVMKDKVRLRKGIVGLEVYEDDPRDVKMSDVKTSVYLILR